MAQDRCYVEILCAEDPPRKKLFDPKKPFELRLDPFFEKKLEQDSFARSVFVFGCKLAKFNLEFRHFIWQTFFSRENDKIRTIILIERKKRKRNKLEIRDNFVSMGISQLSRCSCILIQYSERSPTLHFVQSFQNPILILNSTPLCTNLYSCTRGEETYEP